MRSSRKLNAPKITAIRKDERAGYTDARKGERRGRYDRSFMPECEIAIFIAITIYTATMEKRASCASVGPARYVSRGKNARVSGATRVNKRPADVVKDERFPSSRVHG